jgi:acyl carrier protein
MSISVNSSRKEFPMNETSIDSGIRQAIVAPSRSCDVGKVVREFISSNYLFGGWSDFADDSSLVDSGVLDSTGVLELVSFLEEYFEITVEDSEMVPANLDSVCAISDFLQRKAR